jgi:hypothetical protein
VDCLSSNYYQVTQTVVLIAAVFVAILSIFWNRKTTKQQHTIKLLLEDESNEFVKDGIKLLEKIDNDSQASIETYAYKNNKNKKEAVIIRNLLNYYEMISVGVNRGIYDVDMIRDAQKTILSNIYKHSKIYINRRRTEELKPLLYIEFEKLIIVLNK